MKEFLLVFRGDYSAVPQASPEEMQVRMQHWMNWIGGIAAQDKLSDRGNRLLGTGKTVKTNGIISDGPYTEIKESIMGYTIVKAATLDEATTLVDGCPMLAMGGTVEVREINAM